MADELLVVIGTHAFPSTKDHAHFQFHDYATLTIIGIVIASAAWPIVVLISTAPRWLFFRLAIVVTAVLLLPDLDLLHQGQPFKAVAFLMLMHVSIGVITCNVLVRLAPTHRRRSPRHPLPCSLESPPATGVGCVRDALPFGVEARRAVAH